MGVTLVDGVTFVDGVTYLDGVTFMDGVAFRGRCDLHFHGWWDPSWTV